MRVDKVNEMKKMIKRLNEASYKYYTSDQIMTDKEWDSVYEKLADLEKETGITLSNSPTVNVGYEIIDELKTATHNHPMLSLDKTKDINDLVEFKVKGECTLSLKYDGLATSLRYVDGELKSATTRGNGMEGKDVLSNVLTIANVPKSIPCKEELIVDGEVIIDYPTFHRINESLPEGIEKYKHPRNLVSGSIGVLDNRIALKRQMKFIPWRVIKGLEWSNSNYRRLTGLESMGFELPIIHLLGGMHEVEVVQFFINNIKEKAEENGIPFDGIIISYDNIEFAESLGRTEKFFRHSLAYKFEDDLFETTLLDVEWSTSKTGLVNPVAIFEPVEIDGTEVSRATLHNISYIKDLQLGIGDRIRVYKANMIIPKVHDSLTKGNNVSIPEVCPECEEHIEASCQNESETLHCTNDFCPAILIQKLVHFVSRNAMNIDGLSESTLTKIMNKIDITGFKDIYEFKNYRGWLINIEGLGEKSVDKLLREIEKSREVTLDRFIYSLSIPLIGRTASKNLAKHFKYRYEDFMPPVFFDTDFSDIPDIGDKMRDSLFNFLRDNAVWIEDLASEMKFIRPISYATSETDLTGKTFVITGSLNSFENRDELKEKIESLGGKVSGSVSTKTTYLINNDKESSSSKNKKAKEFGVEIISEEDFVRIIGG